MKSFSLTIIVALCVYPSLLHATEPETERRFEQYKCKLVLPDSEYRWLDHTIISNSTAVIGDDSGTIFVLRISNAPGHRQINKGFIREFDEGFMEGADISKISGEITKFKSIPCYQMHARFDSDNLITTSRAFFANGYLYQLQIVGSELPIDERDKLENIFSSFEFIGTPILPEPKEDTKNGIENIVVGIIEFLIGIIGIVVVVRLITKKKKTNPLQNNGLDGMNS